MDRDPLRHKLFLRAGERTYKYTIFFSLVTDHGFKLSFVRSDYLWLLKQFPAPRATQRKAIRYRFYSNPAKGMKTVGMTVLRNGNTDPTFCS